MRALWSHVDSPNDCPGLVVPHLHTHNNTPFCADVLGWASYNGSCGSSVGLEVQYRDVDLDVVSAADCIDHCRLDDACAAVTVLQNSGTMTCRMASSCSFRHHSSVLETTYVQPQRSSSPDPSIGGAKTSVASNDGSCSFCPEAAPCRGASVCRYGRCFEGPNQPDGIACTQSGGAGGDAAEGVCKKGTCTIAGSAGGVIKPKGSDKTGVPGKLL